MADGRRWWALGAVALGTFMTYLDNNIVNVALPTIQRELGLTLSGLEWITSSYILVFAGLMLLGGRLADVLGRRRVFLAGLVVFTLASLAAGLAWDGPTLIAARAVQGIGAAFLTPTALALITSLFPDTRERGTAIGLWSAVGALSMAFGPLAGGFISERWDWGWVFLINVPLGVATIGFGLWAIRVPADRTSRHLDMPGITTSTIALFALTYALIEGENTGWTSAPILTALGVALLSATLFLVIETRTAEPMIDLSLFRSRVFSGGILAQGLWSFGIFGVYFFSALWLQNILGFSPTEAGAAFVPMALLTAVAATQAQRIAGLIGNGLAIALGLTLMAVAIFALSLIGSDGGYLDLLPWFLLYGLGGGMLIHLTAVIISTLPVSRAGIASGVINVSREVSGLFGVTVLGAILTARQSAALEAGANPLAAFLDGYQVALVVTAAALLIGVPLSLYSLRTSRPDRPQAPFPTKTPDPVNH
ncbi:MFS transporter [Streptosporangium sp. KLBMP 9127]|nr:MFS transporter [Streptosporangium sp. KLBMP 9127]